MLKEIITLEVNLMTLKIEILTLNLKIITLQVIFMMLRLKIVFKWKYDFENGNYDVET